MYTLIAHHRVKDFQVWRQAAAEGIEREKRTKERGILEAEFYQSIDGETAMFLLTFRVDGHEILPMGGQISPH